MRIRWAQPLMGPFVDLTGRRFTRLTVAGPAAAKRKWITVCDCGRRTEKWATHLTRGLSTSCGCRKDEVTAERNRTHNRSTTRLYGVWRTMRTRCENPRSARWKDYGGRGITVCGRWRSFENFLADMGEPPAGLTIDRIDNDRGYEPDNCRWATPAEQNRNRRSPRPQPSASR